MKPTIEGAEPKKLYFTPKEVAAELGITTGMVYILSREIDRHSPRPGGSNLTRKEIEEIRKRI